jgi:hypothetical protein
MAEAYKVLAQSNPAATTSTDVYTVPAATSAIISTAVFCNRSATNKIEFRFSVAPAGAALSNEQYIYYDVSLQPSDTLTLTIGITLETTDKLRVYTDNATLSVNIFGMEIT